MNAEVEAIRQRWAGMQMSSPRHDPCTRDINDLLVALEQLRRALEAVFEVAAVANEGDPWYCENEGIDAEAAFVLARAALEPAPDAKRKPA